MRKLVIILLCCIFFVSCSEKKKIDKIEFDNSYPLALAPDVSWALVTDPYVSFRDDSEWNAEIVAHIRKGAILQVLGKAVDDKKMIWYKFEEGWLPSSCLTIYSNRMKAQTAANGLKD